MEAKILIVLLLAICSTHNVVSAFDIPSKNFYCHRDAVAKPLMLKELSGIWYEIGRAPAVDVFTCLNVTVPATASTELVLDLEYIATWDGSNRATRENVTFPWDEYTQNSIFNLYYGEVNTPAVTYKVVYTDYSLITVICGYAGISPIPLFKILSRQSQIDQRLKDYIEAQIAKSHYGQFFMWTEQSKCNAADRSVAGTISILTLAIAWILLKWC